VRSKADNLAAVLRYVRAAAPCSRAEIASSTGLNKATVSSIVTELLDRRVLREIGLSGRRVGRPATLLILDGSGHVGIGVQVGADRLTVVAVDLAGRRALTWRRSFTAAERGPRRMIAGITGLVRRAAARVAAAQGSVVGLTVAVPGPVDAAGVVHGVPVLGWPNVELRAGLEAALDRPGYPVRVDTDATLGAIAEHRYGTLAGTAHLAYLAGPPGDGVGVINGGVPLRGANGYGGAFGHPCADFQPGLVDIGRLARAAGAAEPDALTELDRAGTRLGHAVAVLADLLNPAVIVLGGHYARLAPWLLPAAEREFRQRAGTPNVDAVRLVASTLGYEAAAVGAAAVALHAIERT
jgi:predicted NBD/HSP70 family sugar kinase